MRILSVDYGEARTGIALSDYTRTIASPFAVLRERGVSALIDKIAQIAGENQVTEIVVGYPLNMDGTVGEKSAKCERLAERLREKTALPVALWDERLTTVEAYEILDGNKRKGKKKYARIDAVAAAVILEGYMGTSARD